MFNFEKISTTRFYTAPTIERVVEFSPPDVDTSNVAKILSLAVDAKCVACESGAGYAQINGRTNFRLVYLDKDGTVKGVDYNADFTLRADGEFDEGDNVQCDIIVTESDVEAADTLTLTAVLEICASTIKRDEIEMLTSADDCYAIDKEVYMPSLIGSKTVTVPFDDDKNVGAQIDSVLGLSTVCITKQSLATDDGATVKATIFARVTFTQDGEIKTQDFAIPVEEELTLDGAKTTDAVKVHAIVRSAKVVLQGVTDDNVIKVEGELTLRVTVTRCEKRQIVGNLYMLTNEVELERNSVDLKCFDGCGYFMQGVSGTAILGDNKPRAISVVALPYARCYTTNYYVTEDNRIVAEGVVNTDIIYTDENGYNSVRAEVPFSVSVGSEIPFSKDLKVRCDVQNVTASVRKDREFDIVMDIAITACGFSPLTIEYISGVTVGEEKEQNTCALSMYVASVGDDMLDVCSALTAMPEDVTAQNPDLVFPLQGGEKIIYFRRLA